MPIVWSVRIPPHVQDAVQGISSMAPYVCQCVLMEPMETKKPVNVRFVRLDVQRVQVLPHVHPVMVLIFYTLLCKYVPSPVPRDIMAM